MISCYIYIYVLLLHNPLIRLKWYLQSWACNDERILHGTQPTSIPNSNYLPKIYLEGGGGGGGGVMCHQVGKVIIINHVGPNYVQFDVAFTKLNDRIVLWCSRNCII